MTIKKTYIYVYPPRWANGQTCPPKSAAGGRRRILCQHNGDHTASWYFYMHDRLGSVRQVINNSGSVVRYYTYKPFGEVLESSQDMHSARNNFMFTGQYYDSEIDEYYLRARMYDPVLGRFISRDPVQGSFKEPLTLHQYLYCGNDTINNADPSGEFYGRLVEGVMAGYSVHYAATAFAAYGVATGNQRFLTLGIGMQRMILPVMALAMAKVSVKGVIGRYEEQVRDNLMGNINIPPGTPKYVAIGILLLYLMDAIDGCQPDALEELPSAKDWQDLRWDKAPENPPGP